MRVVLAEFVAEAHQFVGLRHDWRQVSGVRQSGISSGSCFLIYRILLSSGWLLRGGRQTHGQKKESRQAGLIATLS